MIVFQPYQVIILVCSLLLFYFSTVSFFQKKETVSLTLLLLGAFALRLFLILRDPFLHDWDEHFHALVAKNMIAHPFMPMLLANPVFPYNYKDWTSNHIWLHKQPLFLWQMALSMKLFGVNLFALRLPSALMGTIQVFFIYRIGKVLKNSSVAFFSALFFALSYYQLELTAGSGMDHNDVAFCFYVTASFWAFAEYTRTRRIHWAVLIGLFSGGAILNKWLTGLIVYFGWVLSFLIANKFVLKALWKQRDEVLRMILSLAVCALVFLPWQIYAHLRFPLESAYETSYNSKHIFTAVEGHRGGYAYYLQLIPLQFGYISLLLIPIGLFSIFKSQSYNPILRNAILGSLFGVYFFFSIIVQTKMRGYPFMMSGTILLLMGIAIEEIVRFTNRSNFISTKKYFLSLLLLGILVFTLLRLNEILTGSLFTMEKSGDKDYRQRKTYNTEIYKELDQLVPKGDLVFNCNQDEEIDAMFFSGHTVYSICPNKRQLDSLEEKKIRIAVFADRKDYEIPTYLKTDSNKLMINRKLK